MGAEVLIFSVKDLDLALTDANARLINDWLRTQPESFLFVISTSPPSSQRFSEPKVFRMAETSFGSVDNEALLQSTAIYFMHVAVWQTRGTTQELASLSRYSETLGLIDYIITVLLFTNLYKWTSPDRKVQDRFLGQGNVEKHIACLRGM